MQRANAMNVIFPVRRYGVWAFDDPSVSLFAEPFIQGVPEIIEDLVKDLPSAEDGFALFFAAAPFPKFQAELVWLREEFGGDWYRVEATGREGWLCPALRRYYETAPAQLYFAAEPIWRK